MTEWLNKTTIPAPSKGLWNYNLQRTLGNSGAYLDGSTMNIDKGITLPKGILLDVDLSTRKVRVVKNALVVTGGTTQQPRVAKNHLFQSGDIVYCTGSAVTIQSIDKSNASYDIFNLDAVCAGAVAGAYIENASAAGANPSPKYTPNVILQENIYDVQGGEMVTAVAWIFQDVDTSWFPMAVSPYQIGKINATGRFLLY